ncbi:helix-turn-helix domain-containing protein [Pseudoteredinibacter isoporae]|uniref:helix-turn-helix domain-containing protein n=1 Tax=Pseudoteredinibacter isoporae TaxID=570281 RepID=UPI00310292CD
MNCAHLMITTLSIVERLKDWKGWSYYRTAKELEVSQTTMTNWRKHGRTMSDDTAIKAAELLGLDPAFIIANIHAERAQSEFEKRQLERLVEMAAAAVGPEKSTLPAGSPVIKK